MFKFKEALFMLESVIISGLMRKKASHCELLKNKTQKCISKSLSNIESNYYHLEFCALLMPKKSSLEFTRPCLERIFSSYISYNCYLEKGLGTYDLFARYELCSKAKQQHYQVRDVCDIGSLQYSKSASPLLLMTATLSRKLHSPALYQVQVVQQRKQPHQLLLQIRQVRTNGHICV